MPSARPAKPRVGPFPPAELARMAWSPSYRSPRFRDMADPRSFADRPAPAADLTGRAFLSGHHDGSDTARLVAVQPFMGELARCPLLRNLRRLDLSGNRFGPAGVRELAASPHLDGIEELNLSGNDLGPDGMAALRVAPWFRRLRGLGLADNGLGTADLAGLPPGLADLDVSGNTLGFITSPPVGEVGEALRAGWGGKASPPPAAPLRSAATSPTRAEAKTENRGLVDSAPATRTAGRLDTLRAAGCGLGPGGLGLLDAAAVIDLRRNRIGPGGAVPPRLDHLRDLDLGFNDLGDRVVVDVARAGPSALRSLRLAGNRLTTVPGFPAVEVLDLSANLLGDDGAAVLDGRFPSLTRLDLSNSGLTDAGVVRLVRHEGAGRLRTLSLAWNRVGDAGAKALALAGCPALAGLEELDLTGTAIGFAGAVALAESKHLRLRRLILGENRRLPADAARVLAERYNQGGCASGRQADGADDSPSA